MKNCHLFFLISFFTIGLLFSADVHILENYFAAAEYDDLQALLPTYAANVPDDPSILFFQGFFHDNPDTAATYYFRVVEDHPLSKYADYALFRLGQYFYFNGEYRTARNKFSSLLRNYQKSELKDDAQYLYCQCIVAQGKVDSAKLFLKAFVQNVKRSPYVDSAILDLEELGGVPLDELARPEKMQKSAYTIQIASYKNFMDAKNALYKLARVFPHVEIGERALGNTTYYHVLVGKFDSKEKAIKYANLYIEPHLTDYKVVEFSR